jgi:hypothetical protein
MAVDGAPMTLYFLRDLGGVGYGQAMLGGGGGSTSSSASVAQRSQPHYHQRPEKRAFDRLDTSMVGKSE